MIIGPSAYCCTGIELAGPNFNNPVPFGNLVSLSFVDESDGWAIVDPSLGSIWGNMITMTQVVHWDGEAWNLSAEIPNAAKLIMLSKTDGWAVGGYPYHWDGRRWQVVKKTERFRLYGWEFVQTPDGWSFDDMGGGFDLVLKWDGARWQPAQSARMGHIRDKILVEAENGWWRDTRYEESEAGTWDLHYYMRRWNGREWTLYEPKAPREAEGFAAINANDVWAISGDQLWRWNGSYWQTYKAPLSRSTNAFAFSSDNDVWTVGEEGQIGRWDGNGWKDVYSPFAYRLSDVVFVTPTDGWAVGEGRGDPALGWQQLEVFSTIPAARPRAQWFSCPAVCAFFHHLR